MHHTTHTSKIGGPGTLVTPELDAVGWPGSLAQPKLDPKLTRGTNTSLTIISRTVHTYCKSGILYAHIHALSHLIHMSQLYISLATHTTHEHTPTQLLGKLTVPNRATSLQYWFADRWTRDSGNTRIGRGWLTRDSGTTKARSKTHSKHQHLINDIKQGCALQLQI